MCTGPDRNGNCFRCGKAGHKAHECQNKEKCSLCNAEAHRMGSGKCIAFRRRKAYRNYKTLKKKGNDFETERHGSPNRANFFDQLLS